MMRIVFLLFPLLCACPLFNVSMLAQGSLTPPGQPGPTMQSLDQLNAKLEKRIPIDTVPFDISQPGSYYLTRNLSGSPGIVVHVSGVTIDLNGFALTGIGKGAIGTGSGITGLADTTVRNGRISDYGGDGVHLGGVAVVENLDIVNCGGNAIFADEQSRVRNCRVGATNGSGIVVGDSSLVESSISISNTAASPRGGIVTGALCVISHCSSSYNTGQGIAAGAGANLSNCTASNNAGANAIFASDGSTITNCTASFNTGANGIKVGHGSTVIGCTAKSNKLDGIVTGDGCTISKCTVRENRHHGIEIVNACQVEGNTAQSNGLDGTSQSPFAGIFVNGAGNRIDGNHVSFHDYNTNHAAGIGVNGTGNLIIRNTCHGNTVDYLIPNDNRYGPIVDITAGSPNPVIGKSAPDTTTSTHPWANFVY